MQYSSKQALEILGSFIDTVRWLRSRLIIRSNPVSVRSNLRKQYDLFKVLGVVVTCTFRGVLGMLASWFHKTGGPNLSIRNGLRINFKLLRCINKGIIDRNCPTTVKYNIILFWAKKPVWLAVTPKVEITAVNESALGSCLSLIIAPLYSPCQAVTTTANTESIILVLKPKLWKRIMIKVIVLNAILLLVTAIVHIVCILDNFNTL